MAATKTRKTATKTSRKGRSPEQKREEMEALHQQLAQGVEELRTSQRWTDYLEFCKSFHRYSFGNLVLIFMQNPEASQVAGYRAWQAKGRQVAKGARGLRILGTGTVKVTGAEDEETGEVVEGRRRIFFPVSVFDIAQTELMDGYEDTSTIAHQLDGDDENGIYAQIVEHLTGNGVNVVRKPCAGNTNGYTYRDGEEATPTVTIDPDLSPAQAAKTALHEAAHIELGHLGEDYADYVAHRGRYEVEAESVAYVLAGMLGLDSSTYSTGYVAGWATRAETDVLKSTAARVLAAVHTLTTALEGDTDDEAGASN